MSSPVAQPLKTTRHWQLFVFLALISCLVTFFVNVKYGLIEQRRFGVDLARSVLADPHETESLTDHLASVMELHHDVVELSFCSDGKCSTVSKPVTSNEACSRDFAPALLCVSETSADGASKSVHLKIFPSDSYADAYRDVVVVFFAQLLGILIWLLATKRHRESLRLATVALQEAALHDHLTGLSNRLVLDEEISQLQLGSSESAWLIYLDLDDFKKVNDARGHEVGDEVLRDVARRLTLNAHDGVIARLGGDEFSILMRRGEKPEIQNLVERIRRQVSAPIEVKGWVFSCNVSIGIAQIKSDMTDTTEIKRRADAALYEAKRRGKNRLSFFNEALDRKRQADYKITQDLRKAISNSELFFLYQPIVACDGRVRGMEALARWEHPSLGTIFPGQFIRIAESAGLISQIGKKAIEESCRDLAGVRAAGLDIQFVAINVSAAQLVDDALMMQLLDCVHANNLTPSDVVLEITESLVMEHERSGGQRLRDLTGAGFTVAIDDFGTGYSSLARLQTLPISRLKIDRAFVQGLDTVRGQALVGMMLELSKKLGLACIAEGVENEEQKNTLLAAGCELFQGFLFGQAMSIDDLIHRHEGGRYPAGQTPSEFQALHAFSKRHDDGETQSSQTT